MGSKFGAFRRFDGYGNEVLRFSWFADCAPLGVDMLDVRVAIWRGV